MRERKGGGGGECEGEKMIAMRGNEMGGKRKMETTEGERERERERAREAKKNTREKPFRGPPKIPSDIRGEVSSWGRRGETEPTERMPLLRVPERAGEAGSRAALQI